MTRNDMSVPPMPRVRRSVWVIFAVAIAFAMIVPTVDFFAQWQAPVVLSVTLSTRQPALGQPVQLVVVLRHDHAAIAQQGKLLVTPAMVGMAMAVPSQAVAADASAARFVTTLPLTMVGLWRVTLHLTLPAHAPWDQAVLIDVRQQGAMQLTVGGS